MSYSSNWCSDNSNDDLGANTSLVCPHLTPPRNGKVSVSGRAAGDTATYTCQTGFMVSGPTKRECQSTGVWSNVEPVCSS